VSHLILEIVPWLKWLGCKHNHILLLSGCPCLLVLSVDVVSYCMLLLLLLLKITATMIVMKISLLL